MHVSVDYYSYISGLKDWNAAYKALFAAASLLTVISADRILLSVATVLFMGVLSVAAGRIRLRDYMHLLLVPAVFILTGAAAILIQYGTGENSLLSVPFAAGRLYITADSLSQAIHVCCKAFGAVSALYMLTLSTPMGEILGVLRRLHVPGLLLELMHLIYRYIFILFDIHARQREAVQSRLGYCDLKTSLRSFGSELANLLILSMKKSGAYYDALESRGCEGTCLFWEEEKHLKAAQLLWGAAYAVIAAGILFIV